MPPGGFPVDATSITLQDGRTLTADLIIPAVGQTANSHFVTAGGLGPSPSSTTDQDSSSSLVNPKNGFIRVRPTLQFQDARYPNLFAVGDIADTGAHKAARPGGAQAAVAARNVLAMIEGREPKEEMVVDPASIHLTLGLVSDTHTHTHIHSLTLSFTPAPGGWQRDKHHANNKPPHRQETSSSGTLCPARRSTS